MPSTAVTATSLLVQVARDARTALDQAFAELGLTSQQAGLLVHVFTGTTAPRDLAVLLGTDTAGTTRLVDRLAAKGLVARAPDPHDRRSVKVGLTNEARALVPRLVPVFEDVARRAFRGVDTGALVTVLDTVRTNLATDDAALP